MYKLSHPRHVTGRIELTLDQRSYKGFIAQLVERRTGIAEVMGSNPVEAPTFFRAIFATDQFASH